MLAKYKKLALPVGVTVVCLMVAGYVGYRIYKAKCSKSYCEYCPSVKDVEIYSYEG